jgi:hypothetical protein
MPKDLKLAEGDVGDYHVTVVVPGPVNQYVVGLRVCKKTCLLVKG